MFLIKFLASTPGRRARVAAGMAIIVFGVASLSQKEHRGRGLFLSMLGMVPLSAGSLDFCLLGPIFGKPFNGEKARQEWHVD